MIKFRWYYNKDAETEWLNKMSNDGWGMNRFILGFYNFEKSQENYTYQIDFGDKLFSISDDYREFMNEIGVEVVQAWGPWVFLRKIDSEEGFELYSDLDSRIEHYSKINKMFRGLIKLEIMAVIVEFLLGYAGDFNLGYPFAVLIGLLTLPIINVMRRTSKIIEKLQVKRGEEIIKKYRNPFSGFLIIMMGLFISAISLFFSNYVIDGITISFQVLSILVMVVGVILLVKNNLTKNNNNN